MARRGDGIYKRGASWWLDFQYQGKRHQVRLGAGISKTTAGEIAAVRRAEILKGQAGIGHKRKDLVFDKASKLFLQSIEERIQVGKARPRTLKNYRENIRQLEKEFSGKNLSSIHAFLLKKYRSKRKNSPVAFNREMACLSSLFNCCIRAKRFEGENPTREVERFEEHQSERVLTRDEELRLLQAANPTLQVIILMGIYTGLRVKSEILQLTKSDVDLNGGYLTVQAAYAKNGERRHVPLRPELIDPLRGQMARSDCEWVFVNHRDPKVRLKDARMVFNRACKRAKIDGLTLHCLRHTFATRLVTEGKADLMTVKALGGWKRLDMVDRYTNPTEDHKVRAINAVQFTTLFTTPENDESEESPQVVEIKRVGT